LFVTPSRNPGWRPILQAKALCHCGIQSIALKPHPFNNTAMAYWLFKEEPDHFSFQDLEEAGKTAWDGVTNNLARKHLREVKRGDRILYYHTGGEKAIVGEMEAVGDAYLDPSGEDAKAVVVEVKAVRRLQHPVPLTAIKADPFFSDWELVRISRLSVMPVSPAQWRRIESLSRKAPETK
jgi:predicted RNA-binding protein with PUA-like domain